MKNNQNSDIITFERSLLVHYHTVKILNITFTQSLYELTRIKIARSKVLGIERGHLPIHSQNYIWCTGPMRCTGPLRVGEPYNRITV